MGMSLQAFEIQRLHGVYSFRIPFQDNRVVLAGLNGLGKTTVMTLLFYVLSRQLRRLLEHRFDSVSLHFESTTVTVSYDEVRAAYFAGPLRRMRDMFPADVVERFDRHPELFSQFVTPPADPTDLYRRLARSLEVPQSMLERIADLIQYSLREPSDERELLNRKSKALSELVEAQVVYLPTYRRIERELRDIFPAAEEHLRTRRLRHPERPRPYVELVEFGMEDVARTFANMEEVLGTTARTGLTALVGTYLRTVLRREVQGAVSSGLEQMDDATVQRILDRVEENTLSQHEKALLRVDIARWRSDPAHEIGAEDKYVAHFVSQLVALDRTLKEKEQNVLAFRDVCNAYLTNKEVVYDERAYTLSIRSRSVGRLELRNLSSGEKQIVSLFSHLYLDRPGPYIVLIDEPELSLSVDWQRRLLPDILRTRRCAFLAAATHSPFVFENELEDAAVDLASCLLPPAA